MENFCKSRLQLETETRVTKDVEGDSGSMHSRKENINLIQHINHNIGQESSQQKGLMTTRVAQQKTERFHLVSLGLVTTNNAG